MNKHILIVEDDRTHRAMAHQILLDLGFEATTADNGFAALAKITANPTHFAAVLMDWEMPQMDGLETVRALREKQVQEGWAHIPVIAFTGNRNDGDEQTCIAAGMDDYIPKEIFMPKWRTVLQQKLTQWVDVQNQSAKGIHG